MACAYLVSELRNDIERIEMNIGKVVLTLYKPEIACQRSNRNKEKKKKEKEKEKEDVVHMFKSKFNVAEGRQFIPTGSIPGMRPMLVR